MIISTVNAKVFSTLPSLLTYFLLQFLRQTFNLREREYLLLIKNKNILKTSLNLWLSPCSELSYLCILIRDPFE